MLAPPPSPSLAHLTTADLHTALKPITFTKARFTNWATTFSSISTATFRPETVEQVRLVVELARREGKELRASGSGHSPSDLVCTGGYVINVDKVDKVLEIDATTKTAYVQGGIKLSALNSALAANSPPFALTSLGSISDQTIAGAISTATHGSGVAYGNLSTFVQFIDLVLPLENAPVVRVSRTDDEDLFLSALCGLGVVGLIVGMGIKVENRFKLEEEIWSMSTAEFIEKWRDIAESAEHVRTWWFPQVGEVKVSRLNRTNKDITPPAPALQSWVTENVLAKHFHALVLSVARIFPNILPYHAHLMYALVHRPASIDWYKLLRPVFPKTSVKRVTFVEEGTEGKKEVPVIVVSEEEKEIMGYGKDGKSWKQRTESTWKVDLSENIFNYDCGFPQYTYEGAVPYERTTECLQALDTWYTKELNDPNGLRCHFPIEVRFTEKDDIWLSPTYGQRGTYIGAIQYRPYNLPVPYRRIFSTFESHLLSHGGRPHWAKSHSVSRVQLADLYPRFFDFLRVRERVDPQGVLLNPYTRRHLMGEVGEEVDMRRWKARK
ncbi:hypothetical protein MNV49_006360 [Pseudohyphozyma bogoriensis]|nr:hypothetical protein MNV49_006360 [Pseudohyphozyma bogoriensis]